jgi:hypothetical protein
VKKVRIVIQHVNGGTERVKLSPAVAIVLTKRLCEPGYPYCVPFVEVNGTLKQIVRQRPNCLNVFQATDGSDVIL